MTKVKDMGTMLGIVKKLLPIKDNMTFKYHFGKMKLDGEIWEGITITVDDNEPKTDLMINTFTIGEKECLAILFKPNREPKLYKVKKSK